MLLFNERRFENSIQDSSLEIFPDGRHIIHFMFPEKFNSVLDNFLTSIQSHLIIACKTGRIDLDSSPRECSDSQMLTVGPPSANESGNLHSSTFKMGRQLKVLKELNSTKIKVNNVNINYFKFGNGPQKLLIFPGALGHIGSFAPIINNFDQEKYTIYLWDPPGYGFSRPPNRDFSPGFLSRDADCAIALMEMAFGLQNNKYKSLKFRLTVDGEGRKCTPTVEG
ncbi:hypothetical protein ACI65C_009689 [Semiaphis heraclei]